MDEFRDYRLSPTIRRAVLVIGGIPLLVLVVLAVWHLPVWDDGDQQAPHLGVFSARSPAPVVAGWVR
ncbi:hypothetical protein [Actinophytocola sp.]|uniref:hypothetical protein n=1 Tax=Actinophytocola sp. TaxID=1872138 RepID=UPI00389A9D8E